MKVKLSLIVISFLFTSFTQLGYTQDKQLNGDAKKEVESNLSQAIKLENSGDLNQAAYYYTKVATSYWVNGISDEAVSNFLKAISLNEKIGNLNAIKTIYNNIGMIYTDSDNLENALAYFEKSLIICKRINRKPDITATLINIANIQLETARNEDALKTAEEANKLAQELNDIKLLRNTYSLLADVYGKLGDSKKSSEYFNLFTSFSKKIQKDELEKKEAEARQIVESAKTRVKVVEQEKELTEKELHEKDQELKKTLQISTEQQMQIDLLNKEKELRDTIIKNQRLARNIYITIILGILAFAVLALYSYLQKKKANILLEEQNEEIADQRDMIENKSLELIMALGQIERQNKNITSSITYAHRIQQALLPEENSLKDYLPDSFIILKPRDIVSGDFYWFCNYKGKSEQSISPTRKNTIILPTIPSDDSGLIITAADCTGHGVPGAFMSMIGFNMLETITREGVHQPDELLSELHQSIRKLLKQANTDNRDGMDMAVCVIKDKGRVVEYSGAINPLIYIKGDEIYHIKADMVPVGGMQKEVKREFTKHTIKVDKPTCFYIFSDGFTDQFGGDSGEKYSSKRFKELLLRIHKLPLPKQLEIIEKDFEEWIGDKYQQIDDVLVIGFKLGEAELDL